MRTHQALQLSLALNVALAVAWSISILNRPQAVISSAPQTADLSSKFDLGPEPVSPESMRVEVEDLTSSSSAPSASPAEIPAGARVRVNDPGQIARQLSLGQGIEALPSEELRQQISDTLAQTQRAFDDSTRAYILAKNDSVRRKISENNFTRLVPGQVAPRSHASASCLRYLDDGTPVLVTIDDGEFAPYDDSVRALAAVRRERESALEGVLAAWNETCDSRARR